MSEHQFGRIGDRRLGPYRQNSPGHDVVRAHIVHSGKAQEVFPVLKGVLMEINVGTGGAANLIIDIGKA